MKIAFKFWILLLLLMSTRTLLAATAEKLPPERVNQIAAWLNDQPNGPGQPANNRAFWQALAAKPDWQSLIPRAEKLLATPLPEQSDELFLEFSRNGNRTHWQDVAFNRRGRLAPLVLAECLENKGSFLPQIEQLINAFCAEKTWLLPAHDGKLDNFNGKTIDIDLGSSALGWNLSMAAYLIGDKLKPATHQTLRDNIKKRILDPYKAMIRGERDLNWWMVGTNNWNAVCLAGVTGAGLIELPTKAERAEFVAAAEHYSNYFLKGFTPDGYCSEGLGYWNYGFGHYVLLSEAVRHATKNNLDLLNVPAAKMPARFASRIQIINGIAPAFADCPVFAKPDAPLMGLLNRKFDLGNGYNYIPAAPTFGTLFEAMIYQAASDVVQMTDKMPPSRDYFENAGILIARPNRADAIGVALKGGNNAENHNHNDISSYVVVRGERPILLDPGSETYTARTFSSHRYDSKLLNSFGHPVPVVAGQLQKEGAQSQAKVLKTEFSDAQDTFQLDIASAYRVPELKTLTRTFVYSRNGKGALNVSDHVQFSEPKSFGTAVLTLGSWKQQADGSLLVFDVNEAARIDIDSGGRAFSIDAEEIHEDAPVAPTRLGINLKEPVTDATITLKITPFDLPEADKALLRNGAFEFGSWGWEMPKNGMGAISNEQFASGASSLKISDADKNLGSNVTSARFNLQANHKYILHGKVFHVSGQGIGLYVKFFDVNRQSLDVADANGNTQPVGTTPAKIGAWQTFALPFQTPAGTTNVQLWIHSFNGAQSELFLDDVEIVEAN